MVMLLKLQFIIWLSKNNISGSTQIHPNECFVPYFCRPIFARLWRCVHGPVKSAWGQKQL